MRPALLIDLDDTLYDERSYVDSGFRHVATIASARCGISAQDAFAFLQDHLRAQGRGRLFNSLLLAHGLPDTPDDVASLVEAYRTHRPTIGLAADVQQTLRELRRRFLIAVVTDGLGLMQRRKVEALGLSGITDTIVYCWEHQHPKPSPEGFRIAVNRLGNPAVAAIIGDDVGRDLPAAVALTVPFIRVRTGRFAQQETPSVPVTVVEVASFSAVSAVLTQWGSMEAGEP
jgi:putative hydrolase of the HAD superfamily